MKKLALFLVLIISISAIGFVFIKGDSLKNLSFFSQQKMVDGWRCQAEKVQVAEGASSETVTYYLLGKFRADLISNLPGFSINNHILADSEWEYSWSDEHSEGIKRRNTPEKYTFSDAVIATASTTDFTKEGCVLAKLSASMVELPKGVVFKEE